MKIQLLILSFLFTLSSFSQNEKRLKIFNIENKIALKGYDPVAYFKQKKAIKGKKELSFTYEGVIYNFSTKENKEVFTKMPSIYEPQYGGWCA